MNITISEIHFAIRIIKSRIEWITDNSYDSSEEEREKESLVSLLEKLEKFGFEIYKSEEKT